LKWADFPSDKDPNAQLPEITKEEVGFHVYEDVEKDVTRARWWWSTCESDALEKQKALARVLLHVLKKGNGKWHYFQGMHDIASVILIAVGESGGEAVLRHLIETQLGLWIDKGISPIIDIIGNVFPVVRLADPELFNMIDASGVLPLFCVSWVLTWFTHDVEDPIVAYQLLDCLCSCKPHEAQRRVIYMCAAFIMLVREDVLALQCEKSAVHYFFTTDVPPIVHYPPPLTTAGVPRRATAKKEGVHKPDVEISELQFVVLESAGDLDDLTFVVSSSNPELRKKVTSDAWRDIHHHCTGLIFMEKNYQDVYVSHDSWSAYNTMNRMLKDYEIISNSKSAVASRWTFSSNAGLLLSMDDFWIMNSGLVVIETTLHTWNTTLYDLYCKPESVLSWIRVSAVNLIAKNGQDWAKFFNIANSWTYNNQYMVVDTNKFTRGEKPKEGFLVTTEQVPGYYVVGDRTDELAQRRWVPSINTPFYAEVYNASGYPEKVNETQCDYWSYERCARHLIMKRDVINKIKSYADFKTFMRNNDWSTDPLSNKDPAEAITSRYDLRPDECLHMGTMTMCPNAFGGIDAKTTNMDLAKGLLFDTISSPQYETQPVWEFGTERFKNVRYTGLPKVWKFPWIQFGPVMH